MSLSSDSLSSGAEDVKGNDTGESEGGTGGGGETEGGDETGGEAGKGSSPKWWKKTKFVVKRSTVVAVGVAVAVLLVAVPLIVFFTTRDNDSKARAPTTTTLSPTEGPSSSTSLPPTESPLTIRLSSALVPRHYHVQLQPFIKGNFSVLGSVAIQVEVVEPTARIVLHMADIVTKNDTIKVTRDSLAGTEVGVTKHEYDRDLEYYIGHLEANLEQGQTYFIYMEFTGYLNDQLKGFYRSVYKNEEGEDVYIATTQFQPTDARRAFPCFDEPAMKANFSIAIVREERMTAVSNMPLVSSTPVVGQEGWVLDEFEESVPMSTYLVAFVVSDFVHMDVNTTGGTLFRVFARKEVIELAQYALQLGAEVLTFFENYFNIPYPLPKQDMFAIPDFSAGAMENWGLITYRESLLLYDPSISTVSNKERIGEVVVHELAHQWFGNLVTPSWWTDLWLNEGFATYMSYVGLDPSEPTWSILDQFMPLDLHYVLGIDALPSSHPVSVVVNSPDEISSIFDAISYSKGASIIRMMKHFLREDTFKQGLTEYLNDRAYDAAEQDQLWSALTAKAHEDGTLDDDVTVKEIMDTWTLQMGYPVVTVSRTGTQATVKQERFLLTGVTDPSDEADYMWWVPLTFITESSSDQADTFPSHWLSRTQQETVIDGLPTTAEWVLFNTQQTGYYRVNYDQGNWDALIVQLQEEHTKINPVNRAQIMDDSLNLARAGILPYETSLRATVYLSNEIEFVPWASALSALGYLESMFTRQEDYTIMKRHLSELIVPLYERVGFEDDVLQDPHLTQKLRVTAASWACHLGYQPCRESAIAVFREWRESDGNATIVSPNLKSTVYCAGVAAGDSSAWNFTWGVAQTTNLASERDLLLTALGCSEDEDTLKEYLALTFSPSSPVRLQDTRTVFRAVARRDAGRDVAWDYLEENLPQMLEYTSSFSAVGDYVETAAFEFNTQEELDKLLALQAQHSAILGSGTAAVSRAVQRTRANIEWVTAHYEPIVGWLEEQYPTPLLDIRLPQSLIPHHYLIRLRPFIGGNFSIEGLVSIEMTVADATSQVVLHMADIVTKNETVKVTRGSEAGSDVPILLQEYDPEYQYYVATLGEELVTGETYFISMEFTGFLNDQLRGFYRSVYQNEQGVDVYLAMTMMAPTDARRAFPCFDEPELKANFTIVLGREEGMTALSNMPLNNSVEMPGNPGWFWDEFQTSVRMSTYLVAFAISDFSYNHVENVGASNITFGVTARAAAMNQTAYALEVGPSVLAFYEQYFEIPYPLPKQDMLAAPDFAAGAMENWGLITYRETAIIYDSELSTASSKQRVGAVIAHELAHQWFGNLVTPSWWTDIWLNEGFASYMENIGLQSHETDWGLIDQFVINDLQPVFVIDSLLTSHQISIAVNTTAEINSLFDSISYSKGASLLRMISHFLTEETFRHGLINYLNDKAYQAAAQDDLWEALTAQAEVDGHLPEGVTVKDIMDPWTLQMGYPYITVTRVEGGKATVAQKRFLSDGSDGPSDEPHYMWWIPLSFTGQNNPDFSQTSPSEWLNDTETEKMLENLPQSLDEWVVFNLQETGYYRVNYDKANWNALSQQLASNHSVIHLVNRAQLLDDSLNLARAGILDYDTALSLTAYLATETEFVPWTAGLNGLSYLESMFTRTDGYGELEAYLLDLVVPVFEMVGFTDSLEDPHLTQLLRVTAASWACHLGYQPCLDSALTAFQGWTASDGLATSVSPNLKSTTYCTGVAEGNETVWNFVWAQYQRSGLASEKDLLLRALGCSQETWVLEKYLEMAFTDGSGIRKQDLGTVFQSVASNDLGRDLAWEYLSTNWDAIVAYADTFTILSRLIDSATAEFSSQEELDKLVQFQSDNAASLGAAERSVEQAVERTTTNIAWLDKNYQDILDWVNGTSQTSTERPSSSTSLLPTEPPYTNRLSPALVPRHYHVQLQPFIGGNFSVLGSVTIQVEVVEPTSMIVLHMADIVTKNDTIRVTRASQNGSNISFSNPEYDPVLEYFVLYLNELLEEGQTIFLSMEFVGYLNDQLRGFYRSVYKNDRGEEVYIATTQFQPTDARRAFPCFDEPAMKANFSIAIVREESMTAVSNMPLVSSTPVDAQPGWVLDTFAESVPMSTYLVAFVVSDFTYVNTTTTYGTDFRVYAREGGIANAGYALETGSEILTFFEGYFNISYPLPKQDMFAVPDFAFGAMENWGLIIYRESALLYSPQTSTASNHQRVGVIVAHELAHQWFGNLVTPSWWTDLWLNEGFASYMEYIGLQASEPTWKMMEQFVSIDLHTVFEVDALWSSHPISITVEHPDQINEIFDAISYSKGASIIRMMSHFLNESTFNAGVTNYLRERAYGAAEQDQLWSALTAQAHEDGTLDDDVTVKEIMDTWTLQMGYPVVTISRTGTQATVKQERFLLTGVSARSDEADYMWWVPLTFITESSSDQTDTFPSHWLSRTQQETVIDGLPTTDEWVLFNTQQTGYYRVNYDQGNWDALVAQLKEEHTKINVINRAQIVDDSLNLARAGLVSYATALSANAYLVHETEYVPWRSALRNFEYLESMFSREDDFAIMKKYLLELIVPLYESLGFEDHLTDPHPNQLLRVYVITWACRLGHVPCLNQAQAAYREWVESGGSDTSVAPNLKSTVYCAGVAAGDRSDWDFTWGVAQTTNLASERDLLLTALGCSEDEETLKEYLTRVFTEGLGLRRQDTGRVFYSVASNDVGRDVAWTFLEKNFLAMSEYSGSFTAAGGYVKDASAEFNTQADLDKLLKFKATYNGSLGSAERAVDQAIEGVTSNIAWMTNHYKDIANWLLDRYPSSKLTIRLPSTLVPRHYSLRLLPLLEEGNFSTLGSVQIEVEVMEATSLVVLHMAQIITKNDTIKIAEGSPSGTVVSILRHEYLPDLEFYVANLAKELTVGETYFISMEFVGHLNDNLLGFYRSVYKDEEGQDVFLAATKFQPTYARRAFPCFDEPALKANFSIIIGRPETMTAISNMPRMEEATVSIDDHPGWVWDQFEESVPMPTYLVAFVVSDFNFTANTTAGDTLFRVWARESAIEQADYSLDIGVRGLDFFENYFNIPYPLPKQDMIALPDFSSGAMENWGLITYREVYMLHDPVQSMASQKQLVGVVVIHELAHQWFGNLVTPSWWNDIWLNEGFASYMEYVGIEALEPSWKIGEQFVSTDLHSVFALDCLMSSHPISVQVDHPNQIRELFDSISYSKGASIIRMMEHFLTTETFRKGLTIFLNNNAYDAAEQDQLWSALTAQAHEDGTLNDDVTVKDIMDTWTLQMGYPVVTVSRTGTQATVTQERFVLGKVNLSADEDYTWWVPLSYTTQNEADFDNTSTSRWLTANDTSLVIADVATEDDEWVLFNIHQTGYYRVNYDEANWWALSSQLHTNHSVIGPINRAQLVDDALNLAQSGQLNYSIALDVTRYLAKEEAYVTWSSALRNFKYLESMASWTTCYQPMRSYLLSLLDPLFELVGFEDAVTHDHLTQLLRVTATSWSCDLQLEACVENATMLFQKWMDEDGASSVVSPNLKSTVFCTGILQGARQEWDFVWEQFQKSNLAADQDIFLYSLGCSGVKEILQDYLNKTFFEGEQSLVRKQDAWKVFRGVARNDKGRDLAWDFLTENWDFLKEYTGSPSSLERFLTDVTYEFNTQEKLDELLEFRTSVASDFGTATQTVDQAVERTRGNIAWMDQHFNSVRDWLLEQSNVECLSDLD